MCQKLRLVKRPFRSRSKQCGEEMTLRMVKSSQFGKIAKQAGLNKQAERKYFNITSRLKICTLIWACNSTRYTRVGRVFFLMLNNMFLKNRCMYIIYSFFHNQKIHAKMTMMISILPILVQKEQL